MTWPAWITMSPRNLAALVASTLVVAGPRGGQRGDQSWTDQFEVASDELASTGRNPYFVLEPGYRLVLEEGTTRLIVTVLPETKQVNGVETRVVEERESHGGQLVEVSRNYFALSTRTNSVFYFGEDVDMYKEGRVVSHEGAWQAGSNGARFGLAMPGLALLGSRYYQEIAPKVAMDRARIVSTGGSLDTPAGTFSRLLRVEESTPLEPGTVEHKLYAPGIGLVQDGSLKLVRHGMNVVP